MQRHYWNRLLKYFVTRVASKNDEHSETGNDWRLVIGPTLSGAHIYRSNTRDHRIIDFSRAKIKFISTSRTHQHSWRFKCSGHCWPTASWTDRWSMAFFGNPHTLIRKEARIFQQKRLLQGEGWQRHLNQSMKKIHWTLQHKVTTHHRLQNSRPSNRGPEIPRHPHPRNLSVANSAASRCNNAICHMYRKPEVSNFYISGKMLVVYIDRRIRIIGRQPVLSKCHALETSTIRRLCQNNLCKMLVQMPMS